ncbi:hypothetical protein [Herbiconiux sp.]|uniref:hypothetical protein n=1 Tax=Herbiconiux sp. TaxID=1871186 RepID=UPI0025B91BAE|nr:hypothetical protein [Herbiconiux sp.]
MNAMVVIGPDARVAEHGGAGECPADPHGRHHVGVCRRKRDPALAHAPDVAASDSRSQLPLVHAVLVQEDAGGRNAAERGEGGKEHPSIVPCGLRSTPGAS